VFVDSHLKYKYLSRIHFLRLIEKNVLGEVSCILVVDKDLFVKRPSKSLPYQADQGVLGAGKRRSYVDFKCGDYVGTALGAIGCPEEVVQLGNTVRAGHNVDVGEKDILRLTALARQVPHMVLGIGVPLSPLQRSQGAELEQGLERSIRVLAVKLAFHVQRHSQHTGQIVEVPRHEQVKGGILAYVGKAQAHVGDEVLQDKKLFLTGGKNGHGHLALPISSHLG